MNPAHARNIADLRSAARRRLPKLVFDYVDGGAEEHVTLRANREAFDTVRFAPRMLVDVSHRSQALRVLGYSFDCPFGIAPLGAAGLCWRDAEVALARAARSARVPFVLSMHSLVPLERVAEEAGVAPWCQVYLPNDRTAALALLARVRAAGSEVIVLTADVPVGGNREYNARNGFTIPMRLGLRTVFDGLMHPRWLASVYLGRRWDELRNWAERRDTQTWEHLAWLRAAWRGKLLLKGILRADDARRAVHHGVDGVIVSNHGGRQLDGAAAALEALPAIAAAVGGHAAVLLDGGVCRGSDVVKALALGAEMVLVGRAALYGAAAAGEAGARRALDILRNEVDRVLALVGCNSIAELDPSWLAGDPHNAVDAHARRAAPHGSARRRTVAVTGGGGFPEKRLVAAEKCPNMQA